MAMRLRFGKRRAADEGLEVTEERGVRTLHLGSQAIQSAMRISRPWDLELAYTRAMMGFLMFKATPAEVLMIGLGGGSLAKFIRKQRPQTHITAVEIDPRVIAAARAHFELPGNDATLNVTEGDGALYVRQHPASADVILLDGFDAGNQVEALATQTFYAACRRALKPGGILVVNLWGRDSEFAEYLDLGAEQDQRHRVCLYRTRGASPAGGGATAAGRPVKALGTRPAQLRARLSVGGRDCAAA
jgi:spermidine synthase